MPMPRAASRASSSTLLTPTYVLVTIGGIASATRTRNAGVEPMPMFCIHSGGSPTPNSRTAKSSTAIAGSARPMFERLMATKLPLRRCPKKRPIGSAMTVATTSDTTEICMCCHSRWGMPSAPVQWSPLSNQS